MHNYFHGLSTFPPINGVYLLTSYIAIRSVIEPRLFYRFSKDWECGSFLALVMLMLNYVLTWALYGNVYERIIENDIASINLTFIFYCLILWCFWPCHQFIIIALVIACCFDLWSPKQYLRHYIVWGWWLRLWLWFQKAVGNYLNPNASAQILLMAWLFQLAWCRLTWGLFISQSSLLVYCLLFPGELFPILILVLLYFILIRKF